jgi:uncharacterized protein YcaQ
LAPLKLDAGRARKLAVMGQLLSAPRPRTIDEVVRGLGMVQMDPTKAVARTEHLVLFSRLGARFRIAELERMLWQDRSLFEYGVEIVPTADLPIHRATMRRYPNGPNGELASRNAVRAWLTDNAAFRGYVLRELRRRGPLRARDLEDRHQVDWPSGPGWTGESARYVSEMLDLLWFKGEVMIVGRDGQQRVWDLTERSLPMDEPRLSQREIARRIVDGQLRARGVAKPKQLGWAFDGRAPGWERALAQLVREGMAVPATVGDLPGEWYAHAEVLAQPFRPRTMLLSPFDDLISDRDHTEALFDFHFRLEIYVPKAKRQFGYFVMPVLHGDRLIGRIDPRFDRETGVLHVNAVYAKERAAASWGPAVRRAIDELARWLGTGEVRFTPKVPTIWRTALR